MERGNYKEDIAWQLKLVIGKTFYINYNTQQGSKREKFPRDKMAIKTPKK